MGRAIAPVLKPLEVVKSLVPEICELILRDRNPYEPSKSSSEGERRKDFRQNLIRAVHGSSKGVRDKIPCMLSGEEGNGLEVVAAHIVPASTRPKILDGIPMTIEELQSPRNGLFLAKEVEAAFDRLQISFIPQDILNPSTLVMVIWSDEVKSTPLWKESASSGLKSSKCTLKIGEYEGRVLDLKGHDPIKRALAYQATMAYNYTLSEERKKKIAQPPLFGTPPQGLPSLAPDATRIPVLERIAAGRAFALATESSEDEEDPEEEFS